jgi:PAS domain S-box-containing protein
MTTDQPESFDKSPAPAWDEIKQLIHRLATTDEALESLLEGQVDAVVDASRATTYLLSRAQKALRESDERLRFATEAAGVGIWDLDLVEGTTWRTPRYDLIFGYESMQPGWTYARLLEHVIEEDRAMVEAAFQALLESHESRGFQCRIRQVGGAVRWIWVQGRCRYDDQGRAVRMLGVIQDISDGKRTEENLRLARLEAERANRAKSEFLANMSHEIRTPLSAIIGFAELLLGSSVSEQERLLYLTTVARNGRFLMHLLDDILDLAKVEAGRLQIEQIPTSLETLLSEVLLALSHQSARKGVSLRVEVEGFVPQTIRTDPTRLRQILLNIVGNAVKFTAAGEVVVRVAWEQAPEPAPSKLVVTVEDTGPGMTSAQQEQLFQAFSQADASMSRTYGGTGLGLALSRRLARALGGDVELVESRRGRGSTFRLAIEARPEPGLDQRLETPSLAPPEPTVAADVEPILAGVKVLLAEDQPDSQLLVSRVLARAGALVDVTVDGLQAVEQASKGDHDLILMDLQMPKMSGYDATEELRRRGYDKPIVALTAHMMPGERDRCLRSGCTAFVAKPFSSAELVSTVARHAGKVGRDQILG